MKALPDTNPPIWLGLPVTAETQLKVVMGQKTLSRLNILQGSAEDVDADPGDAKQASAITRNSAILETMKHWLGALPVESALPEVTSDLTCNAAASALDRCILREIAQGKQTLLMVREGLKLLM